MPTITANECSMYYQADNFTDPWVEESGDGPGECLAVLKGLLASLDESSA